MKKCLPSFEIIFILLLLIANGVFAMSEIALVSARKVGLQQRARTGDARARAALELANAPERFLSTVQIGITLVGILAGAFGGATFAEQLAAQVARVPALPPYSEGVALAGRAPEIWAGVSAWVPISDLNAWYRESSRLGTKYVREIAAACGGRPADEGAATDECRKRSPLTTLSVRAASRLTSITAYATGATAATPYRSASR